MDEIFKEDDDDAEMEKEKKCNFDLSISSLIVYVFILRHYNFGVTDRDIYGKFESVKKVLDGTKFYKNVNVLQRRKIVCLSYANI